MLRCGDALPRAGFERAGSRLRMVSSLDWRFELLFCVVLPLRQHVGGQPWWAQFFQGSGHTRHQGGVEKSWVAEEFLDQFMSFYRKSIYLISFCSRQQELDRTWKACIQAIGLKRYQKIKSFLFFLAFSCLPGPCHTPRRELLDIFWPFSNFLCENACTQVHLWFASAFMEVGQLSISNSPNYACI